jgi:hypothetical protein
MFLVDLCKVCGKYRFHCQCIYDVGETTVTTVPKPTGILARKGVKQVGAVTSAERFSVITMAVAGSAGGDSLPSFFVFSRKNFLDYCNENGPEGNAGSATTSGRMV